MSWKLAKFISFALIIIMVDVLGTAEAWKEKVEKITEEYNQTNKTGLKVVVNSTPSLLKLIQKDYGLPDVMRRYAANEEEIAIQETKSFLGLKRYRTVVALEYPYNSRCIVTADKSYDGLSKMLKEVVSKIERAAIYLP